jgi:hypothetical protein
MKNFTITKVKVQHFARSDEKVWLPRAVCGMTVKINKYYRLK